MTAGPGPEGGPTSRPASRAGPLLEVRAVSAGYGRARALFEVSLGVEEATSVAVIGPNGAGKTTLARVCSGLVVPSAGQVSLAGRSIRGQHPYQLARLGLVHVPEGRGVFASLSVEENLTLGLRQQVGRSGLGAAIEEAYRLLPRLGERRAQAAGTLSGGEQRMLGLARALVRPPRLLVVDEPTLGLDPAMVEEVHGALRRIAGAGATLVLMDQEDGRALALADRYVTLRRGRIDSQGPAAQLAAERPG